MSHAHCAKFVYHNTIESFLRAFFQKSENFYLCNFPINQNLILKISALSSARIEYRIPIPLVVGSNPSGRAKNKYRMGYILHLFFIQVAGLVYHHRAKRGAYHRRRRISSAAGCITFAIMIYKTYALILIFHHDASLFNSKKY